MDDDISHLKWCLELVVSYMINMAKGETQLEFSYTRVDDKDPYYGRRDRSFSSTGLRKRVVHPQTNKDNE